MFKDILLAFIPIFVAVDAVGVLPIFMSLTEDLKRKEKKEIILQSIVTAFCVAAGFIFLGKAIFRFLGITIGDFMVAGGVILFCIAILDVMRPGKERRGTSKELGAVPIGTPLIAGPAVLTTSLILIDQYGLIVTLVAVLINILLVGIMFFWSEKIMKFFGHAGSSALSKIMALFLGAIAIMMIRKGISHILSGI